MVNLKRVVLLAGLALTAFACRAEPPVAEQVSTMEESEAVPAAGAGTQAFCPQLWTCNHVKWYGSEAACTTACGRACELDYRCTTGCVCP